MFGIVAFILILAAIYAVKAVAIVKQHSELAAMTSEFSWQHARKADVAVAAAWSEEPAVSVHAMGSMRTIAHA